MSVPKIVSALLSVRWGNWAGRDGGGGRNERQHSSRGPCAPFLAHPTTSSLLPRSQSRHRLHHRRQTQDTEYPSAAPPPHPLPTALLLTDIYISSPPSTTASSTLSPASPISTATPRPSLRYTAGSSPSSRRPPATSPVLSGTGAPLVSWGHTLGRFFSRCAPVASALSASVFSGGEPAVACVARLYGGSGRGCGTGLPDLSRHMCRQTTPTFADPSAEWGARPSVGSPSRGAARVSSSWRDGLGASVRGIRSVPLSPPAPSPAPSLSPRVGRPPPRAERTSTHYGVGSRARSSSPSRMRGTGGSFATRREDGACVYGESIWRKGGCEEPFGREGEGCGG
ncbi:hypothetical protein B0H14DRAFT_2559437 [Mycena olivaceomarginata]|nr:hypothetical protein B0H14DRAFT_2559437 [Mycena olivaceomarginata]